MTDQPDLVPPRPALSSSTFWMTAVLQVILLVNAILKANGKTAIDVPPEVSLAIASLLAGLYVSWRHWNQNRVNMARMEIALAKAYRCPRCGFEAGEA